MYIYVFSKPNLHFTVQPLKIISPSKLYEYYLYKNRQHFLIKRFTYNISEICLTNIAKQMFIEP